MKHYEKYKPSGVDWIGEIPSHWEMLPLRRITKEHRQGYYISGEYINEGVKLIRITDLQIDGTIKYDEMPFVNISERDETTFQVKNGDFLFPRTGSIGLLGVVNNPERAVFASYLINFRFQKKVKSNFLKYYFSSQCFKTGIETDLHGGVNKNIHAENIKNQVIAIPSIEEQIHIANFLEEKTTQIDKLISNKQKLIELLKEERTAIINEAVSGKGKNWGRKKLKYVAKLKSGDGITADAIRPEGDYPVYGGNGLRGFTSEFTHEGNYVLIGRQGALCGNINYAKGKFFASEHAVVASILDGSEFIWLGELLRSMNLNQYSQASAQPGLSVEKIQNLIIPLPALKEQTAIVQQIQTETKRIDNTISKIEKEIELMNEYRTALISEVVTGRLKVI